MWWRVLAFALAIVPCAWALAGPPGRVHTPLDDNIRFLPDMPPVERLGKASDCNDRSDPSHPEFARAERRRIVRPGPSAGSARIETRIVVPDMNEWGYWYLCNPDIEDAIGFSAPLPPSVPDGVVAGQVFLPGSGPHALEIAGVENWHLSQSCARDNESGEFPFACRLSIRNGDRQQTLAGWRATDAWQAIRQDSVRVDVAFAGDLDGDRAPDVLLESSDYTSLGCHYFHLLRARNTYEGGHLVEVVAENIACD